MGCLKVGSPAVLRHVQICSWIGWKLFFETSFTSENLPSTLYPASKYLNPLFEPAGQLASLILEMLQLVSQAVTQLKHSHHTIQEGDLGSGTWR